MKNICFIFLAVFLFLISGIFFFRDINTSKMTPTSFVFLLSSIIDLLLLLLVVALIFNKTKNKSELNEALKKNLQKDEKILSSCPLIHPQWEKVEMLYVTDKRIFTIDVEKGNPTFNLGKEIFYDQLSSVNINDKVFLDRISLNLLFKDNTDITFETNKSHPLKNIYKIISGRSMQSSSQLERDTAS